MMIDASTTTITPVLYDKVKASHFMLKIFLFVMSQKNKNQYEIDT